MLNYYVIYRYFNISPQETYAAANDFEDKEALEVYVVVVELPYTIEAQIYDFFTD